MSLTDDLEAYALTKVSNFLNTSTVLFSGVNYNISDITSTSFCTFYSKARFENGSGIRAIFMPGSTIPISMTNATYIALIDSALNSNQQINDIYLAIINQIIAGTIVTPVQLDSVWTSLNSTYTTNRISGPGI